MAPDQEATADRTSEKTGTSEPGGQQVDRPKREFEGWAPTDQGGEAAKEGERKAFVANDTQDASHGTSDDPGSPGDPKDTAPEDVGESISRRGEEMSKHEGKEPGREEGERQGASDRPTGTSSGRDTSSVQPHDTVPERSQGGQGG